MQIFKRKLNIRDLKTNLQILLQTLHVKRVLSELQSVAGIRFKLIYNEPDRSLVLYGYYGDSIHEFCGQEYSSFNKLAASAIDNS